MPKIMIRMLMEGSTTFLNYFPAEQGIQGDMTPSMIVDKNFSTTQHSSYSLTHTYSYTGLLTILPKPGP